MYFNLGNAKKMPQLRLASYRGKYTHPFYPGKMLPLQVPAAYDWLKNLPCGEFLNQHPLWRDESVTFASSDTMELSALAATHCTPPLRSEPVTEESSFDQLAHAEWLASPLSDEELKELQETMDFANDGLDL